MTLVELLNLINQSYPDNKMSDYFDPESGQPREAAVEGDGLAAFLVREIAQTFDKDADAEDQLDEAITVMRRAYDEIGGIVVALEERQTQESFAALGRAIGESGAGSRSSSRRAD